MNGKILINVFLPQVSRSIEVWVPLNLCIGEINPLLGQVASAVTGGQFASTEVFLLCEAATGKPYAQSLTPAALGLQNGANTMLV